MAAYNIGEEITGLYLQFAKECAFVQYNVYTPDVQGEIDVVAINFNKRIVYVCEVAVHLITGLQYVKNARPDTAARLIKKFRKDVDYAEKAFSAYERVYMLWSPIVKQSGPNSKYDQMKAVVEVRDALRSERNVEIELVINEKYQDCLAALRDHASRKTEELRSPVLRLFQLESRLERHVASMKKKATKSLPSSQQF